MNTSQLAAYMRRIIDDPGVVGFPYSLQGTFLEIAYYEWRAYCPEEMFEVEFQPPLLAGAFQLDLENVIFGDAANLWVAVTAYVLGDHVRTAAGNVYECTTAGTSGAVNPVGTGSAIADGTVIWAFIGTNGLVRAQRFTRVISVDATTGNLLTVFQPASSFENLGQISGSGPALASNKTYSARWWLDGYVLRFNVPVTGTIKIWYMPDQEINWAAAVQPGANQFIKGPAQFHDIIALLASQQYKIKEGRANPALDDQLARKLAMMERFFAQTRSGRGSRYVQDERWR